jgi:hypothetical protein
MKSGTPIVTIHFTLSIYSNGPQSGLNRLLKDGGITYGGTKRQGGGRGGGLEVDYSESVVRLFTYY